VHFFYKEQDPQAQLMETLKCALGNGNAPGGILILLHKMDQRMPLEMIRIGVELAGGSWYLWEGTTHPRKRCDRRSGVSCVCCLTV